MGKKKSKKLHEWVEEQKPTPKQVEKIVKRTFGTSHWRPQKDAKKGRKP